MAYPDPYSAVDGIGYDDLQASGGAHPTVWTSKQLKFASSSSAQDVGLTRSGTSQLKVSNAGAGSGSLFTGGLLLGLVTKAISYTIAATDCVVVANAASLVFTLPAPAAAIAGQVYMVKNNNQTTTGIKTNTAGVLIDGVDCSSSAFTTGLTSAYGVARLITDGTNWYTI